MSAAWLLSRAHRVTVYEQAARLGGHSNTIEVPNERGSFPVDMGFIVYNEPSYPNLTALLRHLGVPTAPTDMSFAVSLDNGRLEYGSSDLGAVFAQKRNLVDRRFWSMLADLVRFYREAPRDLATLDQGLEPLGSYLERRGFGQAFIDDHLLPMAAAIWSTPPGEALCQPAAGFIRFCENHGLLKLTGRPVWRTVVGGSKTYVSRLTEAYADTSCLGLKVREITRDKAGVTVRDVSGEARRFDHVVIAAHADQALAMLADPSNAESCLLSRMRYGRNEAVMHRDASLMPARRRVWSSWNYLGTRDAASPCVTYWMNRLQPLATRDDIFVTLNPVRQPAAHTVIHRESYTHPLFDTAAARVQRTLWSLQGQRRTWFCGAYFGAGFHEDGLQSGLAVAEALGGIRRPWTVANDSGRIWQSDEPARLAA
jgi:predicted NAD/FAD-binding protein